MVDHRDKRLFTPGPLTTSSTVRQAMLRDLDPRDRECTDLVQRLRHRLLALGGVDRDGGFEAVLLQGTGTYGVESVVSSAVPRDGKLMVMRNGAYGARIARIAHVHGIELREHRLAEDTPIAADQVGALLRQDPEVTHVALVHGETTTGLLNPLVAVAEAVRAAGRRLLVDAVGSFGAVGIDLDAVGADFLVAASGMCLESVPGLAIVLARRAALEEAEGRARTLSLDLAAQWRGLDADGTFRFTPPTHALLALAQALAELEAEGGVAGRGERYRANQRVLHAGMRELGFRRYLAAEAQGPVLTTFHCPADPNFAFERFRAELAARGFVIHPGAVAGADVFRIGNMGRLGAGDVKALLGAMKDVLSGMGVAA